MKKFATNNTITDQAQGTINSSTEVLANNLTYAQDALSKGLSDIIGDIFKEGIVDSGTDLYNFYITISNNGTSDAGISVGMGVGYKYSSTTRRYERIAITDTTAQYNAYLPTQTTYDGNGKYVSTPKSSGCANIPLSGLVANNTYWIDLQYLFVCDNGNTRSSQEESSENLKNYSIAYDGKTKRFYQWTDGYNIVLQDQYSQCQGLCLGTVVIDSNNIVTVNPNVQRAKFLTIKTETSFKYLLAGKGLSLDTNEQGYSVFNVQTDNKTISVNSQNQLQATVDTGYGYTRFAVNSGYTDFLSVSGVSVQISFGTGIPLVVSPAYANRYTIDTTETVGIADTYTAITYSPAVIPTGYGETPDGKIYTMCVNNTARFAEDKTPLDEPTLLDTPILEIMKTIYVCKLDPAVNAGVVEYANGETGCVRGDIWLDMSVQPYVTKWYDGTSWHIYHGVPLGLIYFYSGDITDYTIFDFNKDYTRWGTVGSVMPYTGGIVPDKYILADGSNNASIVGYNDLYRKIDNGQEIYGSAVTTGKFVLPTLIDKVIWGSTLANRGTYLSSALPNIKGTLGVIDTSDNTSGPFYIDGYANGNRSESFENQDLFKFDASRANSVYKDNQSIVQPPALGIPVLIKYTC